MATLHYTTHSDLVKGRKRRLSEDEDMSDAPQPTSPIPAAAITPRMADRFPIARMQRQQGKPEEIKRFKADTRKRSTTTHMLATLTKDNLIGLVTCLIDRYPAIRHNIIAHIPPPTVQSATEVLLDLRRKLEQSFPYNRNGPSRNNYTFSRVREPLFALIDSVARFAEHFTSPSSLVFPTDAFEYLDRAAQIAHGLPDWEDEGNNQPKHKLYLQLNSYWMRAIENAASSLSEGHSFSHDTVSVWSRKLAEHDTLAPRKEFRDAVNKFFQRLGHLLSSTSTPPHHAVEDNIARFSSPPPRMVAHADVRR
ncbi:Cut8 six-helix bundle-domain-containing protein [Syncephalastrum racemosum]|uniref:Tethering factor for nuclear proteasome STS1 n=1 Tax=Syncephalastrum racemosum TaxID=13706 RepID=A0A1X2HBE8_SYNRA|nr:Cut8 six-helix bundle-domain-containing protein [Syncephalastrum racemosum]